MKKLFLITALILVVSIANAQVTTSFNQIYRNNGSGASGSTWAAAATHYSEFIDMTDVDSAQVVFNFPDSVDVDVYVENYTSQTGVVAVSGRIGENAGSTDSVRYVTDGTGKSWSSSLGTNYKAGFPLIRLKLAFQTGSDTQGTEKYKMYIKRFRHQ